MRLAHNFCEPQRSSKPTHGEKIGLLLIFSADTSRWTGDHLLLKLLGYL
ncbi:hypothetical protein SAMN06296058_1972 [Pseudoxanthomonas indica]|uniref:Uncharacterized protein n=1 Tax=Pseudoxanthomonas indica TaxID=428993 RepID=A0A1T5KSD0_9GAMM|nr:hypothetical protein SAMN06296058_1972 [Pseudoxanthomonas indica]